MNHGVPQPLPQLVWSTSTNSQIGTTYPPLATKCLKISINAKIRHHEHSLREGPMCRREVGSLERRSEAIRSISIREVEQALARGSLSLRHPELPQQPRLKTTPPQASKSSRTRCAASLPTLSMKWSAQPAKMSTKTTITTICIDPNNKN